LSFALLLSSWAESTQPKSGKLGIGLPQLAHLLRFAPQAESIRPIALGPAASEVPLLRVRRCARYASTDARRRVPPALLASVSHGLLAAFVILEGIRNDMNP
jgi:hypothetical protein